jgi:putative ABC transport system permease protein
MAIPLAYNLRNMVVRKTTTLMTALGIALTVAVLLSILALVDGLRATLSSSGDPLQVIVTRKGATSELVSVVTRTQFQDLKFLPAIARGRDGQPLASLEVITLINLASVDSPDGSNITVRGLLSAGIDMRRNAHISSGRWFTPGRRELVAGRSVAQRFPGARIGKKVLFGRGEWEIVGVMETGSAAQSSEIWGDLNQVSADLNRVEYLSSALLRATDEVTAKALINSVDSDRRFNLSAQSEREYYDEQTRSAAPIEYTGILVAVIMAVGSAFAAMNTMYAAVARRAREIGTLRVLGFSRSSILSSFLVEGVLLSALGGLLGCLLVLPLDGVTTAIGNSNFSDLAFAFRLTPPTLLAGLAFAVVLGSVGGLFPAGSAARKQILTALREG